MNAFGFALQKVLELRRKQLELAEANTSNKLVALGDLDRCGRKPRPRGSAPRLKCANGHR
jgi:hypothetical protein